MDREPTVRAGPGAGLSRAGVGARHPRGRVRGGEAGEGRLVFVSGDAGIGESALVRAFCSHSGAGARVLVGACDGCCTPRPLGPLADIGRVVGGHWGRRPPWATPCSASSWRCSTSCAGPPTVLVLEDVHWADEATLDVLGCSGDAPALPARSCSPPTATTSCRDPPAADRARRPRAAAGVLLHRLAPLSVDAVAALAAPHGVDAVELHADRRQPVLRHGGPRRGRDGLPDTIRDAVLARAARLGGPARRAPRGGRGRPAAASSCGSSRRSPGTIATRSTNASPRGCSADRHASRSGMSSRAWRSRTRSTPHGRLALHRAALRRSLARGSRPRPRAPRPSRRGRARRRAVLESPRRRPSGRPSSGPTARRRRSTREPCASRTPAGPGAPSFSNDASFECYMSGSWMSPSPRRRRRSTATAGPATAGTRARCLCAPVGTPVVLRRPGRARRRRCTTPSPSSSGSGRARRWRAPTRSLVDAMNLEQAEAAFAWGERAFELPTTGGHRDPDLAAQQHRAMALLLGRPEGRADLERSIALAEQARLEHHVGGATAPRLAASGAATSRSSSGSTEGSPYCTEHGLELWRLYLMVYRARHDSIRAGGPTPPTRLPVLRQPHRDPLLGSGRCAPRGRPRAPGRSGVSPLLDEALAIVGGKRDLQHLAPVAVARAEAAALAGGPTWPPTRSTAALAAAVESGAGGSGRAGALVPRAGVVDGSRRGGGALRLHVSGDWEAAAALWRALGCPYEAALALGEADDASALLRALAELGALGAGPAAARSRGGCASAGCAESPRGPRPRPAATPPASPRASSRSSASSPKGSATGRSRERLFLSGQTIDHHCPRS